MNRASVKIMHFSANDNEPLIAAGGEFLARQKDYAGLLIVSRNKLAADELVYRNSHLRLCGVIQFFLTLPPGGTIVRKKPVVFPVDPAQVIAIGAPTFADLPPTLQNLLTSATIQPDSGSVPVAGVSTPAGEDLYTALPPRLKAALLNLFLKSSNT